LARKEFFLPNRCAPVESTGRRKEEESLCSGKEEREKAGRGIEGRKKKEGATYSKGKSDYKRCPEGGKVSPGGRGREEASKSQYKKKASDY